MENKYYALIFENSFVGYTTTQGYLYRALMITHQLNYKEQTYDMISLRLKPDEAVFMQLTGIPEIIPSKEHRFEDGHGLCMYYYDEEKIIRNKGCLGRESRETRKAVRELIEDKLMIRLIWV